MLAHLNIATINIVNELWGFVLSIVGAWIVVIYDKTVHHSEGNAFQYLKYMLICNAISCLSDAIGCHLEVIDDSLPIFVTHMCNTVLFFFDDLMIVLLPAYILSLLNEKVRNHIWFRITILLFSFCVILLILTQFTNVLFYIDDAGLYHRGPWFIVNQLFGLVAEVGNFIIIYRDGDEIDSAIRQSIYCYCIIPMLAVVIQILVSGVALFLITTTFCVLIMVICLIQYSGRQMYEKQRQLQQQAMNAMVSQLQPHFMYNSISSIMGIEGNPPETRKALAYFGKYLRNNLDVLRDSNPIPFEKELQHVEAYVNLEKIRFDDKLEVEYHIEEKNFTVPALCVQMMVENAIKHGITKKKDKGRVIVSSLKDGNYYKVTIEDDGAGFDPQAKPEEGRSHVGLESTKTRLEHYGGTLEITSAPGAGSKIVIIIPEEV